MSFSSQSLSPFKTAVVIQETKFNIANNSSYTSMITQDKLSVELGTYNALHCYR